MEKIDQVQLRIAQKKMLEILVQIDQICRENDIKYWLEAGTLLGSVRHSGFIPWDDDLDIGMLRNDFERFLLIAPKMLSEKMFLQTFETDPGYINRAIPCKVRLNDTLILEESDFNLKKSVGDCHKGFFADVFPMDFYSKNRWIRKGERLLSKLYYAKFSTMFIKHKNLHRKLLAEIMKIIPWRVLDLLRIFLTKKMNKNILNKELGFGVETVLDNLGYTEEKDLFPLDEKMFEGHKFYVPKNYKKWLHVRYGDSYMNLPPEHKRKWHAVKIECDE